MASVGLRGIASVAAIAILTAILKIVLPVNALTAGFLYLIVILILATTWGLRESVLASASATVCLNYFFLPPVGRLTIADPQNWVALFTFLITSLVASQLSERARFRAQEATKKQLEMEQLYALSRGLMLREASQPIGTRIAAEIARVYDMRAVALYDGVSNATFRAGPEDIENTENLLRDVARGGAEWRDSQTGTTIGVVRLGNRICGSLALRGQPLSDTGFHALTNLAAIALESDRSRELAALAEAERHSEQFKSMLLDGLAHEFKTPLTSIRAAASALTTDSVREPEQRTDLLRVIDQESQRLTKLVTEAMHLSRIEAGKVQLNRSYRLVRELIQNTLNQMETSRDGRRIDVDVACPELAAVMDFELMQLALRQLLDNAMKYSPRDSSIQVRAAQSEAGVRISVHNSGDAIPGSEQHRLFDRFYRGPAFRNTTAGTGMGLPVAREILRAHGGDIDVESSPEHGTEFTMILPLEERSLAE